MCHSETLHDIHSQGAETDSCHWSVPPTLLHITTFDIVVVAAKRKQSRSTAVCFFFHARSKSVTEIWDWTVSSFQSPSRHSVVLTFPKTLFLPPLIVTNRSRRRCRLGQPEFKGPHPPQHLAPLPGSQPALAAHLRPALHPRVWDRGRHRLRWVRRRWTRHALFISLISWSQLWLTECCSKRW